MAATTETKFPLTLKPYGKRKGKTLLCAQWEKKIDGKQKTFGASPKKNDFGAMETALANDLLSQQDSRLAEMAQRYFHEQAKKLGLDPADPRDPRDPREPREALRRLKHLMERVHQQRSSVSLR